MLSRGTEPCTCCCVHEPKIYEGFSCWKEQKCSDTCYFKAETGGARSDREETLSKTNSVSKTKRKGSGSIYSRSFPSLSSHEAYSVRGSEICKLDPSEQASYYRSHVTQESTNKLRGYVYPHLSRRRPKEQISVSPQIASQGQGLRILPMKSKSHSTIDTKKLTTSMEQAIKRAAVKGAQTTMGSIFGSEYKGRWAYSFRNYNPNSLLELNSSREIAGRGKKRPHVVPQRQRHHRMVPMSDVTNPLEYGDSEDDTSSAVCFTETKHDLTTPLRCFPLGASSSKKSESKRNVVASNQQNRTNDKKNPKGPPSLRGIPPLPMCSKGVVFKQGQPTHLLQHQYSVRFNGVQNGFRYETLYLNGRGGSDSSLTIAGPWITPSAQHH